MRSSAVLMSGLAAVASATTSSWGYTTSTSSSSSSSYDPTWSGEWTSSTTSKAAVSTSTSYDPSWSVWTSSTTSKVAVSTSSSYDPSWSEWTSTSTSTSYDPTWSAWTSTSTSYDPSWNTWDSSYTTPVAASKTPCPAWTGGAAPPPYYTNLPDSIKSALPSWTGAPPSDYCYYTSWMQSFSSCTAPAVASPTTFASTAAKATGTAYGTWSGTTGVAPIATFKGAANANAASYAVAGLAAAAALVMA